MTDAIRRPAGGVPERPDAAREMLRWIEAYDGHSYCATQRGELDECDCGHQADLDRWRDALARRAAEAPGDRWEPTVEEVAEWLRRAEGRIEDIFGLWVQGKRDDRWVAEKLIGEGHLRALAADSRPDPWFAPDGMPYEVREARAVRPEEPPE